ncbi:MAG: hypothetical protein ACREMK_00315 [Gemmatimonadota bacterium]
MKVRPALLSIMILMAPAEARAQQEIEPVELEAAASPVTPAAYVSDGRRDPFLPLTGTYASEADGAPRLEQLELTGIFMGAPGNSLVVLEDHARRGHFVRVGESLGNARLLEILPDQAVFEVDDYGILRRDTLRLVPDRGAAEAAPKPHPDSAPAGSPSTDQKPAQPQAEEDP